MIWAEEDAAARRSDLPAYRLGRVIVDRVLGPEADAAARLPPSSDMPEFAEETPKGGDSVGMPG